jgi:hypothetical protein
VHPQQPDDPPCNTIIYRTIRRKDWFDPDDETRVKGEAFMCRRPSLKKDGTHDPGDDDGLSVYDSFRIDRRVCIENELSCYGIATHHVGTLRKLGLIVIRDPNNYQKLLIPNMPLANPGTVEGEDLLEAVADTARIAERCRWKKPE